MTFRNVSVIDYLISSLDGYPLLNDFQITDLDNLYSDGHALIHCQIRANSVMSRNIINNKRAMMALKSLT
jgi:hypothetical protein